MKKKSLFLTVLVLALVLSAAVGSAWAYFTANASAQGSVPIELGGGSKMDESFASWTKTVTITYDLGEDGTNTQPVYVRFIATGPVYKDGSSALSYVAGENWVQQGDYWYYKLPLSPENMNADTMQVAIKEMPEAVYDEFLEEGDSIEVLVAYEFAPVLYDADGNPLEATDPDIWDQPLKTTQQTFTEGGD